MSPPDPDPESAGPSEPHRIVCGLCESVLDETYANRALADQAADDHVPEVHPEHPTAIVLAVPVAFLEERPGDALAIAVSAQERVGRRHEGADEAS